MLETIQPEFSGVMEKEERAKEVIDNIPHRIGVHSGKGGVGKTTVAASLAAVLARKGRRVCLLDADIDCPDVGSFLGIKGRFATDGGKLLPFEKYGMQVISPAFLLEREDQAVLFRGPMKHHVLVELLTKSQLQADYLVVDLPPGTSDIPLTVMRWFGLEKVVFVTTPQKAALNDTARSIEMARKLGVDIAGIIENMAGEVFGTGGGEELARRLGVKFLFRIKLDKRIRIACDNGMPAALSDKRLFNKFDKAIQ